jgi:hypothetical protein
MTAETFDKQAATEIIQNFDARAEMLVQILHEFIARFGWISDAAIRQLAEELNISRGCNATSIRLPVVVYVARPHWMHCVSSVSNQWAPTPHARTCLLSRQLCLLSGNHG